MELLDGPFMPGRGIAPPHLVGRGTQRRRLNSWLAASDPFACAAITGHSGTGKSVLMDLLGGDAEQAWTCVRLNLAGHSTTEITATVAAATAPMSGDILVLCEDVRPWDTKERTVDSMVGGLQRRASGRVRVVVSCLPDITATPPALTVSTAALTAQEAAEAIVQPFLRMGLPPPTREALRVIHRVTAGIPLAVQIAGRALWRRNLIMGEGARGPGHVEGLEVRRAILDDLDASFYEPAFASVMPDEQLLMQEMAAGTSVDVHDPRATALLELGVLHVAAGELAVSRPGLLSYVGRRVRGGSTAPYERALATALIPMAPADTDID